VKGNLSKSLYYSVLAGFFVDKRGFRAIDKAAPIIIMKYEIRISTEKGQNLMKFGNYYVGQNFYEIENELEDISEQMFSLGFMKAFNDERIFKGKKVTFLDHSWDTVIGITNEKIYKIALQYMSVEGKPIFDSVLKYFIEEFGVPNEHKHYGYSFFHIWDTEWGNIILERKGETEGESINIFLTSNAPIKKSFLF